MTIDKVSYSPREDLILIRACEQYPSHFPGKCTIWVRAVDGNEDFKESSLAHDIAFSLDGHGLAITGPLGSGILDITGKSAQEMITYLTEEIVNDPSSLLPWQGNSNALSPDGQWVAITNGPTVYLRNIHDGTSGGKFELGASAFDTLFFPDSQRLIVWRNHFAGFNDPGEESKNSFLKILETSTGKATDLAHVNSPYLALTYSPDGKRLATRDAFGRVRVWDLENGDIQYVITGGCMQCGTYFTYKYPANLSFSADAFHSRNIGFSPDGAWLAVSYIDECEHFCGSSGYIQLYHAESGEAALRLEDEQCQPADSLSFSADGKSLASTYENKVCIWSIPEGELTRTLTTTPDSEYEQVSVVAYSVDGKKLAAGSTSGEAWVWDTETWKVLWSLPLHRGFDSLLLDLIFSKDDQVLVSAGQDGTLRVRNSTDGASIRLIDVNNIPLNMAASSNGQLLICGEAISSPSTAIYDIARGEILRVLGNSRVVNAAFSPDGRWLATVHNDGRLYFWGIPYGR